MQPPCLVLFDIDNTLLWSGGAGTLAMTRAFRDLFGIDNAFQHVEFSGRTDTAIVSDALRLHALADGDLRGQILRFKERYVAHLAETIREVSGGRLMPGIPQLLEQLAGRPDVHLGLATGNFRAGAELKLRYYRLDGYFQTGGFGDDAEDRALVVGAAIERAGGPGFAGRAVVVGDTPHDVSAAKANGAFALAVATGRNSAQELAAAGADAVFEDCTDPGVLPTILGD